MYKYISYRNRIIIEGEPPPFLSGDLVLVEKTDNYTFKFKLNDTYFHPEPPDLERDKLGMSMDTTYKNGSRVFSRIKRYKKEFNESEDFTFTYLDADNDSLITEGDMILVEVHLDVSNVDGFHFRFHTLDYDGYLSEYDVSDELP